MWEMRAVTLLLFVLARREKTVVLLLIGVLLRGPISINGDTDPSDDSALRAMYSSLNSPSQLTKWSQAGGDPCGDSWKGITCSGSSVTEITLSSLGLSGSLGYQLSSLKSLTNLDMSNNNLGNQINEKLPPNLQQLNLTGNSFNGYIPFSICQMTSLKYLNLGHNLLEGKVNDMFGQLSALQILDLSFNSLTGDLPQSFSSLTNMTDMYLQNNRFTGTIDVLANLPLENLNVENNDFSGWIPKQLKNIIVKNGNPLNSGPAPPPPASNGNRNPKPGSNNSQSGGGGSGSKKSGSKRNLAIGVGTGASATGMVIAVAIFCFFRRKYLSKSMIFWKTRNENNLNVEGFLKNCRYLAPKRYSYTDIKKMTNSFKDKLGQGGYGRVYKGKLQNGCPVAVKVLNELKGNGEEFVNEVASISKTSHVNVVTLLGFCSEGPKRALIYELMPNGSLEKFIYEENSLTKRQLGWETLYQIAVGTARGLEYLHRGCNTRILHLDIKPHNILLDGDFCPKISDFGLAKLCTKKEDIVSMSGMRGTAGYIAPEVFCRNYGGVSHKSDVYSYGMMVLEMVGGRKNINVEVDHTSEIYFPHWIYKRLELDEEIGLSGITDDAEKESARKMIVVGLWCIQTDPTNRPSMTNVVEMLEGSLESLQIPPKPFLSSPPRPSADSPAGEIM